MSKQIKFSPDDEEFFGSVGSFGVPKFDNAMHGGVPRGFFVVGFTETGSGSELFAKQLTSPAEEPDNTILISTNESQLEIARVFKNSGRRIQCKGTGKGVTCKSLSFRRLQVA